MWRTKTTSLLTIRAFCSWSRAPLRVDQVSFVALSKGPIRTYVTSSRSVTPVEKLITDSIKASGPISVSAYTQLCLSHPTEGYYMKQRADDTDVFGLQGDFITSPEISQVFGELVGVWLLSQWMNPTTGNPLSSKIRLIELGPGRGTLMDDVLRTLSTWPHAKAALSSVHLVETSPVMRSRQDQKLAAWRDSLNLHLQWYESIDDIPQASEAEFTMIVAHEFFDALPVNILEKTQDGFREVLVDIQLPQLGPSAVPTSHTAASKPPSPFRFVLSPSSTPRSTLLSSISRRFASVPLGSRIEVSSTGWRIARRIGEMVSGPRTGGLGTNCVKRPRTPKGVALIMDYGDDHVFGASFRAFRAHRLVDVFETPGISDLTTNVDFAFLKEALESVAATHGPLQQSKFLLRMGLAERLAALMKRAPSEERRLEIERAGRRLVDRSGQGMGTVYRALGITGLNGGLKDQVWPFVSTGTDSEKET